jgi:hypothetical protein
MQAPISSLFGLLSHLNLFKTALDKKESVINNGMSVSFLFILLYF